MRRCALERLRSALSCLLVLPILECRDRNLQQAATARSWPLPPLQSLKPLQPAKPSKSNLDSNPPQRGHSPTGPETYAAVCSGATQKCFSWLLNLPILDCRNRTLQRTATARSWPLPPLQSLKPLQPSKSNLDPNPAPRGHSPAGPETYAAVCSGATRECLFMPAKLAEFGMQGSESAAGSQSTNLAASTATNSGTASTVKTKHRRQSPAAGTLPDGPCKLCGGVLWSDSGMPFPARLSCRFWNAEIGICSRQPKHKPGRFHRYKHWHRFNRQNQTSTPIPRIGDTPRRAPQPTWRCALDRLSWPFPACSTHQCWNAEIGLSTDSQSTNLAASTTTNTGTASTVKIEPRRQSPAAGTLPDWPCKLRGGVLWSDSRVPFSTCLTCRFWSAELGLCSRQPQHKPGRFNRYKQWNRFNRQNRTST